MKRLLLGLMLTLLVGGCGKEQANLSSGKTVTYWLAQVKDPDAKMRKKAVFKLGNVGPAEPAALPAVLGALADQDPAVRCEAILAVVKFGEQGRISERKLADMRQNDSDNQVRAFAGKALEKFKETLDGG